MRCAEALPRPALRAAAEAGEPAALAGGCHASAGGRGARRRARAGGRQAGLRAAPPGAGCRGGPGGCAAAAERGAGAAQSSGTGQRRWHWARAAATSARPGRLHHAGLHAQPTAPATGAARGRRRPGRAACWRWTGAAAARHRPAPSWAARSGTALGRGRRPAGVPWRCTRRRWRWACRAVRTLRRCGWACAGGGGGGTAGGWGRGQGGAAAERAALSWPGERSPGDGGGGGEGKYWGGSGKGPALGQASTVTGTERLAKRLCMMWLYTGHRHAGREGGGAPRSPDPLLARPCPSRALSQPGGRARGGL